MTDTPKYKLEMPELQTIMTLFLMTHPVGTAKRLFNGWDKSKILCDYERPSLEVLTKLVEDIRQRFLKEGVGY